MSLLDHDERDQDMVLMGSIFREIRVRMGANQTEIATRAAVNPSYLSALENGIYSMSLRKFLDVCQALTISPDHVMAIFCRKRSYR